MSGVSDGSETQRSDSSTDFRIEEFELDDMDGVLRIERRSFTVDVYPRSKFISLYQRGRDMFLVVREEQEIVGYIAAFMDDSNGYIDSMAVDPDYRRRGLGTALVKIIKQRFITKGAVALTLHVRTTNDSVIDFYQKLEFIIEATVSNYYSDGAPAFYMKLPL